MSNVLNIAFGIVTVVAWVGFNNWDVARACARPNCFPWMYALWFVLDVAWLLPERIVHRDYFNAFVDIVAAAMCARILWHWWRRRRQGKPSRVLGIVRNLGHRLAVTPIPIKEN